MSIRLEHCDWLIAPWGVALAPLDFGRFSHDLLIGQFAGGGDTQSRQKSAGLEKTFRNCVGRKYTAARLGISGVQFGVCEFSFGAWS